MSDVFSFLAEPAGNKRLGLGVSGDLEVSRLDIIGGLMLSSFLSLALGS